jgi:SAM-dependent methyltransferase
MIGSLAGYTAEGKSAQDALNQSTWSRPSSIEWLSSDSRFRGEDVAHDYVAERLQRRPILDLGVGTGRTIPLLSPLTDEYRAIDYLPAMVERAHARYPYAHVQIGDARNLNGFQDGHFGLVNFSFNGIDAVSSGDRKLVLREARRVLAPGGMFLFSTLNLEGPASRERPWHVRVYGTRNPVRYAARAMKATVRASVETLNWFRLSPLREEGPGYAVAPLSAHNYGLLVHFTTLHQQIEELVAAGFSRDVVVLDNETGKRVALSDDKKHIEWFHLIARPADG